MSEKTKKTEMSLLAKILFLGFIAGFIYGLFKSIFLISNNKYFAYKLYNLIFFNIQENITTYAIIGLLTSIFILVSVLASKIIAHIISSLNLSPKNKINLLVFSLIAIIFTIGISYIYYLDIITFLKSSEATIWLASFSKSKEDTYFIFITTIALVGIYLIALISYIIWQSSIENFSRTILNKVNPNIIRTLGIVIIITLLSFNAFIFGYKNLNRPEGPNIVLITIDTLRADHLGVYGHNKNTSQNIDTIAEKGVLFENAFSQAPWTLPAMASIHTSLYPSEHGADDAYSKLSDHFVTIGEILRNNFYKTIGVISQSFVSSIHGFSQGYDIFDEKYISGIDDISSELITKRAIKYIEENKSDSFFLWIHYFDPHQSYINHKEFNFGSGYEGPLSDKLNLKQQNINKVYLNQDDIDYIKNIYDEEIAFTDKYIGDLINTIHDLNLEDNTIIIVTSDHGEEFLERTRIGHGKYLYQELINIPLIIYDPTELTNRGKRIKENVETSSIAYTIVDLLGIENNIFGGINLLEVDEKKTTVAFSEGSYAWGSDNRKEGIIYENWKLIRNLDDESYELYNLDNDPDEKINLIGEDDLVDKDFADDLKTRLASFKKQRAVKTETVKFNKEDVERLKALGYIQ